MATSCKSEDEDDINKSAPDGTFYQMGSVLKQGHYSGYWIVNGFPADSCEMSFDGTLIGFSNMPVTTILREAHLGLVPFFKKQLGPSIINDKDIIVNNRGFVVKPVLSGVSANNVYISSSFKESGSASAHQGLAANMDLEDVSYLFSATDGEDTWYYGIVFNEDNYGVLSKEQSSRVIKFTIKQIIEYDPPHYERRVWGNLSIPLIFISNDL
jgi:hypothetical protein